MDCLLCEFFNQDFNIKSSTDLAVSHDTASADARMSSEAGAEQGGKLLYHDPLLFIHGVNDDDSLPLGALDIHQEGCVGILSLYLVSLS